MTTRVDIHLENFLEDAAKSSFDVVGKAYRLPYVGSLQHCWEYSLIRLDGSLSSCVVGYE